MSPATLLLIDDHPLILQLRKQRLEELGYSVITASNASSVLATLKTMSIAAVLVEYKLEAIDAEAITVHIKRRFPEQPVILLSAYAEVPERILWLVDEYLMRSDTLEKLVNVIESLTCTKLEKRGKSAIACNRSLPAGRSVA